MQELVKEVAGVLNTIQFATLGTVTPEGKPWNNPVQRVVDKDLNIYWFSDQNSQHSINVRDNARVFIVLYDSTVPAGSGLARGAYFEAGAEEITDPATIVLARTLKGENVDRNPAAFTGEAVRRVYKATPLRAWTNTVEITDGKFIRDYRVELPLEDLTAAFRALQP